MGPVGFNPSVSAFVAIRSASRETHPLEIQRTRDAVQLVRRNLVEIRDGLNRVCNVRFALVEGADLANDADVDAFAVKGTERRRAKNGNQSICRCRPLACARSLPTSIHHASHSRPPRHPCQPARL